MKFSKTVYTFLSVLIFVVSPLLSDELDPILYNKIKESLSDTHHQVDLDAMKLRLNKIHSNPLPYLIKISESKDSYVFVRARAIRMMETFSGEVTIHLLEKTIANESENVHLRKLAVRSYSSLLKNNQTKRNGFLKQFETDKHLGNFLKQSVQRGNLDSMPSHIKKKDHIDFKREEIKKQL